MEPEDPIQLGCQTVDHRNNAVRLGARCWLRHLVLRGLSAVERRIHRLRHALVGPLAGDDTPPSCPAIESPGDLACPGTNSTSGSFAPGEVVEVLSAPEIQATLDATGRCEGLLFMEEMAKFCGRPMVVKKKVGMFFDEGSHRMLRMKRKRYLLEGAVCHGLHAFAMEGCDRCCFFFWTDRWLRRATQSEIETTPHCRGAVMKVEAPHVVS